MMYNLHKLVVICGTLYPLAVNAQTNRESTFLFCGCSQLHR